jgi:periplasmic protein TonB
MPSLLGDRGTPQAPLRSRRAFAVSLVGHVALFVVIATVSLRTAIDLPQPHAPLAFLDSGPTIRLADLPSPQPSGSQRHEPRETPPRGVVPETNGPPPIPGVPTIAPDGFAPDKSYAGGGPEVIGPPGGGNGPESDPKDFNGFGPDIHGVLPPPLPPAAPRTPIRLHSGVKAPLKVVHTAPVYPPIAQSARVQGTVILEAIISDAGLVESVRVLRSVALLDDAAIAAVRQWRYQPALVSGTPVPVIITVTVDFRLAP